MWRLFSAMSGAEYSSLHLNTIAFGSVCVRGSGSPLLSPQLVLSSSQDSAGGLGKALIYCTSVDRGEVTHPSVTSTSLLKHRAPLVDRQHGPPVRSQSNKERDLGEKQEAFPMGLERNCTEGSLCACFRIHLHLQKSRICIGISEKTCETTQLKEEMAKTKPKTGYIISFN